MANDIFTLKKDGTSILRKSWLRRPRATSTPTPADQSSIFNSGLSGLGNKGAFMWYFSWILGVLLACAFGIINVMWMETEEMLGAEKDKYVSLKD
jgi:cyd operon protein YbgT